MNLSVFRISLHICCIFPCKHYVTCFSSYKEDENSKFSWPKVAIAWFVYFIFWPFMLGYLLISRKTLGISLNFFVFPKLFFELLSCRCREKQRKEASRLQTVNRKLTAMNKLLMEENDRLQKQVSQLVYENGYMRQQLQNVSPSKN